MTFPDQPTHPSCGPAYAAEGLSGLFQSVFNRRQAPERPRGPAEPAAAAAPEPEAPQPETSQPDAPPSETPVNAATAPHAPAEAGTPVDAEDVLSIAVSWLNDGETVALATVTETWGSSPRPPGSQMAITLSGRMAGSVSGGCVEGAVVEAAQSTLAGGPPQLMDFGVTDERAWEVGLACGGKLVVFVEALA